MRDMPLRILHGLGENKVLCSHENGNLFSPKLWGFFLGKCHKTYLIRININLRHFYVMRELWKVVKNNQNRNMIGFTDFTYDSVWNILCFLIFIFFIAQYLVPLVYFSIFLKLWFLSFPLISNTNTFTLILRPWNNRKVVLCAGLWSSKIGVVKGRWFSILKLEQAKNQTWR